MPYSDRARVVALIAEINLILRDVESDDLRETLTLALAECRARLAEPDAAADRAPERTTA